MWSVEVDVWSSSAMVCRDERMKLGEYHGL
jgi:hypothetical protein